MTLGEDRGLANVSNIGVDIALSPDGSRLVYVGAAPDGGTQLWQRALDDLEPDPIPGTEGALGPVLSPDGLSVVFSEARRSKKTVSLSGGPPFAVVAEGQAGRSSAWGSDGMIYFGIGGVIHRVPATGGEPEAVTSPSDGGQRLPDALPDGRGLLLTVFGGSTEQSRIAVVGPEGGEVRELFQGTMARYAASGHVVYATADGTLMAAPFDLKRLEVTGPSVALVEGVRVENSSASQFALSQTGSLVYVPGSGGGGDEFVWVTRSGQATPVDPGFTFELAGYGWRLSPDGTRVVFSSRVDGNEDIRIKHLPDGPLERLTFEEASDIRPFWTPDGQTVTYFSGVVNDRTVWSKDGVPLTVEGGGSGESPC